MKAAQDIILTPVITERSVDDMAESKYTFKVAKDANKVEIAKAAEELFQVQVLKVNTVNCTGHSHISARGGRRFIGLNGHSFSLLIKCQICGSITPILVTIVAVT